MVNVERKNIIKKDAIQFIIELTNKCNFRCKYCYLEQAERISANSFFEMSVDTGIEVIDRLYSNFSDKYERIYVDFLDGEPLLNFSLLEKMVLRGEKLQGGKQIFVFRFTTNGSLLTREIVEFTVQHNIYFNISVDGTPTSHDVNRILMDGRASSPVVFDKLDFVSGMDNIGVVSTFSPQTLQKMTEGTAYLMEKKLKHIEINICMGNVGKFDKEKLRKEYSKAIDLYLKRYEIGDFSCTYVILDDILKKIFENNMVPDSCIHPFKITYDGKVKSCDRIPDEKNSVLVLITDLDNLSDNIESLHYCKKNNNYCDSCSYRGLCTPCGMYINQMIDGCVGMQEEAFCIVMQTLIDKAEEFYKRNRNNFRVVFHFNDKIREAVKNGEYVLKTKA